VRKEREKEKFNKREVLNGGVDKKGQPISLPSPQKK
jgi:hypothetical protein